MKRRFALLIGVLAAGITSICADEYCGEAVTLSGKSFNLTCEKDGNNYVMVFELNGSGSLSTCYAWGSFEGGSYGNYADYASVSGNTITFTFPNKKPTGTSGAYFNVDGSGISQWPTAIDWNAVCSAGADVPTMKSVTVADVTAHSVTLDLTAVVNGGANEVTQYSISVNGNPAQLLNATGGQVTITGLSANTEYTFSVYAFYNGNLSPGKKEVTTRTNKESECEGTRGHFAPASLPEANFKIDYDQSTKTITWTLDEINGSNFTWVKIEWDVPGVGNGAATSDNGNPTYKVNLSGSRATYSLQVPDSYVGKPMGILFLMRTEQYGDATAQTAENKTLTNPDVIYYVVGECGCAADDGQDPVMGAVSVVSATSSTVTLNVAATDNSGPVNTFIVNGKTYTASGGTITVDGLSMCTNYTLEVYAQDASCRQSANATSVSFKTLFDSEFDLLESAYAEFGYEGNYLNKGDKCIDGDFATRGGTQNGTLEQAWLTIDLASAQTFNRVDIYWEAARPGSEGYDIEGSMDGTHYFKIGHYGEPGNHPNTTPTKGNANHLTRHDFASTQARYIRVKALSLFDAGWGISIWEIEVYNVGATECPEEPECPQIVNAYVQATTTTTATLNISVIDMQTPNPDDLEYDIRVVCSPDNLQYTNPYHFAVGEHSNGIIPIEGLVPGAPYNVTVKINDGDTHTPPCDSIELSFRTLTGNDCANVIEGNHVLKESVALPSGLVYTYSLTRHNDGNGFDVEVTFNQDVNAVSFAQHFDGSAPGDCYSGWVENALTRVNARKYTGSFSKTNTYTRQKYGCDNAGSGNITKPLFPLWPDLEVALKIVTTAGTHYTLSYPYNPTTPCNKIFAIYHHDDVPADDLRTTYAGGEIPTEIYYFRHADPGEWEPMALPFTVDRVSVYDSEDKQYYELKPQRNSNPANNAAGTKYTGQYWIRQQKTDVSGADFENAWFDANDLLPQKNTAYNFRVPSGSYYQNKYIIFHGAAGQTINASWTLGTASTADDQYRLFGNTTMMPQTLAKAYQETADGEYYRMAENWTLHPFECYVLASANTMKKMNVIARWRSTDTATGIENADADRLMEEVRVFNQLGCIIGIYRQCSLRTAAEQIAANMGAGCYILSAPGTVSKILIP